MTRFSTFLSLLLLLTAYACEPADFERGDEELGTSSAAIVNGSNEYGWQAVGALTVFYGGYGYAGSFCTATLIDEEWILTAAHCLTEHEDMPLAPDNVFFFVGTDARPSWGDDPRDGDLYAVDEFHIHPDYQGLMNTNDIGLVHLSRPLTDVTAFPFNDEDLTDALVGEGVFYAGFGVTNGANNAGGGIKRSTTLPIDSIYETYYAHSYDDSNSGVCFGDSGGPGLLQIDGEWLVIGVNSAGDSEGYDPCKQGYSIHTRTDHYSPWIYSLVGGGPASCLTDPDLCACDDACTTNGVCDDSVCDETTACDPTVEDCPGEDPVDPVDPVDPEDPDPTCVDADDDGYCADVDCNDGNNAIHPGAHDMCGDGVDGDCDGVTDQGCPVDEDEEPLDEEGSGEGNCSTTGRDTIPWPLPFLLLALLVLRRKSNALPNV